MNVRVAPEPGSPAITLTSPGAPLPAAVLVMPILFSISFVHLINDMVQALLPAMYPLFRQSLSLSFAQVGILAFVFQTAASLLQPIVGAVTDKRPMPFSLPLAMACSFAGIVMLSQAGSFTTLVCAAAMVGIGSSIFHPEASRVARMAGGGRHGLAQAVFQVGGNGGSAFGPLLAALIVVPYGQGSALWFCVLAAAGLMVMFLIGAWYRRQLQAHARAARKPPAAPGLSQTRVTMAVVVLLVLIFSKYVYMTSLTTYYTFYLIDHFHASVQVSQLYLFAFMGSVAVGVFAGGPIGDLIGRRYVIWGSILGTLPFSLALPYMDQTWTLVLTIPIGLILASAFSAILVYAQDLLPGRIGMVAGLFYGFAFGIAGIAAAALGVIADRTGIDAVYQVCAFLPAIGIVAWFLPDLDRYRRAV